MRFTVLAVAAVAGTVAAQVTPPPDYKAHAAAGMVALQRWYHEASGLWDQAQWWQQACILSSVAQMAAADRSFVPNATHIFDTTFQRVPGRRRRRKTKRADPAAAGPNWQKFANEYYDDAGWWALAWIAGHDLTKQPAYLALAEAIFDQAVVARAAPSRCGGGGIMWKQGDPYVNAIANELYLSVAAHLATRSADPAKRAAYLQRAKAQWTWFKGTGMINAQNLINDGLDQACRNDGRSTVWSYNQGVILGALVQLNRAEPAPDNAYLVAANHIATAAIAKLADPATKVLHDACEIPDATKCDTDQQQFKGIFMRNLLHLHQATPNDAYATFIRANADSVQQHARFAEGTFGVNWAGPPGNPKTASTTSSALDAIIAAAAIAK